MGNDLFASAYALIEKNEAQKRAVDTTEGPLLVLAGPGTGKTQLLSVRVGKILLNNPTILPSNILCLTFTESGAANMRERLAQFIGQDAYNVTISTYHAFGGELIRRFPEYFTETRLQNPIDDLGKFQIVSEIVDGLSYKNPLKQTRHHLRDLISTISEVKRALLTSDDLRAIAKENQQSIDAIENDLKAIFTDFKIMPRKLDVALPYFTKTREALARHTPQNPAHGQYGSLLGIALQELDAALEKAESIGKATPLTPWKNTWLAKNSDNQFVIAGALETARVRALADILDTYEQAMQARGLYDFDDMILRAIEVLEKNDDLKFTLQEQYLYVLLDEFQDTNASQLRLVQLLTDNPVHEGRPNVMAVGDDDQAIYAFQGAQYSNMIDFYSLYKDVAVVNLSENYRSHKDVLHIADKVTTQIESRVFTRLENMTKTLNAANDSIPDAEIIRAEFVSDIAQYDWIASQIEAKIKRGTHPSEIAVLAPKHSHLEPLVDHLNARNIPLRYEKRENILKAPVVRQIITMSRLVSALSNNNISLANSLWPEVMSFDFWQIATSTIWKLSWAANDETRDHKPNWSKQLLESEDVALRRIGLLFLTVANRVQHEGYESILDDLIGTTLVETGEKDIPQIASPLRDFLLSSRTQQHAPEIFYETISHLTVLRAKLRDHQNTHENVLLLDDFLKFISLHEQSEQRMTNTSPYTQKADAVQLMTVFKAKGLEFDCVFLPSCQDEVWGGSGTSQSNKLKLPANLTPIRHSGATDDERLRLLFVAITRAKHGLYLTSHSHTYTNKATKRLKYFDEQLQEDGTVKTLLLPEPYQAVVQNDNAAPAIASMEIEWRSKHTAFNEEIALYTLLKDRLTSYKLSPTHLNTFTDLIYGGPNAFFFNTLLRFPHAPSVDGQFGNAIHETLEWLQYQLTQTGELPQIQSVVSYFNGRMQAKKLLKEQLKIELERGEIALAAYLAKRGSIFKPEDKAEINFRNENVIIDDVLMAGKIDRMEIDTEQKTIVVVDYKTGKSFNKWSSDPKLHKYKQQLYCYKLLIENSRTYSGYTVTEGRLEFIEPDKDNQIVTLSLTFEDRELERIKQLLNVMWSHVQSLQFPDIRNYPPTLVGIKKFEEDLLSEAI